MNRNTSLPVAIIGSGPVGLAAAAHLHIRKQPFVVFEAAPTVAANVLSWKHIRIFSPWRYNIDAAARQLLNQTSWEAPAEDDLPTGEELYEQYLRPFSELGSIKPHIFLNSNVISIGKKSIDKMKTSGRDEAPYVVRVQCHGEIHTYEARAVIDTSGTWGSPNPLGADGYYAAGEKENHHRIFYGIPDVVHEYANRYKNKNVLVAGSGHSAINTILELLKLKQRHPTTEIHWVLRRKNIDRIYGGKSADTLWARGALGTKAAALVAEGLVNVYAPFHIHELAEEGNALTVIGFQNDEKFALPGIDEIICTTGSRPDFSFLREVRLSVDPALESSTEIAALIDPNLHSCGTVRPHGEKELRHADKNFYIAGAKSYGRAPTFLMATGYEQVRSIAAAIDGDDAAATYVSLDLPSTGVCSASYDSATKNFNKRSCC